MGCGFLAYLQDNFSYYRAPEGTDPVGKIIGLGQVGFIGGTFAAIYDACLWSHCANAPQFLNTLGYWVVPLTGMCVSFSAVTYTLCRVRNKDDTFNYIGGALSSGAVFHTWQKCPRMSGWVTVLMVTYAILKKQAIQDGQSRALLLTEPNEELHRKWYLPWRNLQHRNYSSEPWFPHDKEDYYVNHY